ncbi:MAG: hypothetical protein OEW32_11545 [Nitrospira sp.]|nr:hypothetical protein [Nitrospira sp.]
MSVATWESNVRCHQQTDLRASRRVSALLVCDTDGWSAIGRWCYFGVVVGLATLMGCGHPPPDGQMSENTTGAGEAVVSSPTDETARAAFSTQTAPLGPTARQTLPRPGEKLGPLDAGLSPTDQDEARPGEPLVVPTWMATALASPDVAVRLHALDRWALQGQTGSVDPLMLALTDPDKRVQARALAFIEEDWAQAHAEEE